MHPSHPAILRLRRRRAQRDARRGACPAGDVAAIAAPCRSHATSSTTRRSVLPAQSNAAPNCACPAPSTTALPRRWHCVKGASDPSGTAMRAAIPPMCAMRYWQPASSSPRTPTLRGRPSACRTPGDLPIGSPRLARCQAGRRHARRRLPANALSLPTLARRVALGSPPAADAREDSARGRHARPTHHRPALPRAPHLRPRSGCGRPPRRDR